MNKSICFLIRISRRKNTSMICKEEEKKSEKKLYYLWIKLNCSKNLLLIMMEMNWSVVGFCYIALSIIVSSYYGGGIFYEKKYCSYNGLFIERFWTSQWDFCQIFLDLSSFIVKLLRTTVRFLVLILFLQRLNDGLGTGLLVSLSLVSIHWKLW